VKLGMGIHGLNNNLFTRNQTKTNWKEHCVNVNDPKYIIIGV